MIRPIGPYIFVKPNIKSEEVTKSGLIIQKSKEETTREIEGEVVSLGTKIPLGNGMYTEFKVKVGDKVLFAEYVGKKFTYDDVEYIRLLENDITGVIDEMDKKQVVSKEA